MGSLIKATYSSKFAQDYTEKRIHPRYPISLSAELIEVQANIRIIGRVSDISKSGCYVDTICPFPANSAVSMNAKWDQQSFRTGAMVVYSKVGMGMGLSFKTIEPDQLGTLLTWLDVLAGTEKTKSVTPIIHLPSGAGIAVDHTLRDLFADLIFLLRRVDVITDREREEMLRKLLK